MKRPLRILMISDVYFPRVNGVSTSIRTYRHDLQQMGHRCVLVAPEYPARETAAGAVEDDTDVMRLRSRPVPRDPEDRLFRRDALRAIEPRLTACAFDVIHVQTPFAAHYGALELARQWQVPVVETYHTYFEHYIQHYAPALPGPLLRYVARRVTIAQCRQVSRLVSPSRPMADALRAYGVATAMDILPTGLPPDRFLPGDGARFRQRHGIRAGRPMALFVGRVAHEKNIDFLLQMWPQVLARVPEALLVIAGEGPAVAHCHRLVQALGLQRSVLFLGYLERGSELSDCYRSADVFVFASRTETQGLVLLEAMAQGTPPVSTAVMGTADVLRDARGAVVVPEERAAFATAVADLLQDPARRDALSGQARDDAARWSARAMARRLVALYEEVILERRVARAAVAATPIDGRGRIA